MISAANALGDKKEAARLRAELPKALEKAGTAPARGDRGKGRGKATRRVRIERGSYDEGGGGGGATTTEADEGGERADDGRRWWHRFYG
jgi:hypothetical protein